MHGHLDNFSTRCCVLNITIHRNNSSLPKCASHNPSLGLVIKVRACKGAGQEGSLGITSHALKSVGKCEGMNLHTPK
jgi:hypothetical protein